MDTGMNKMICDVYDVTGRSAGKLSVVHQPDRILHSEMRYYIPDSVCFQDDKGMMLASDTHGFVCHLFEPEVKDKSLRGTHYEYTVHPDLYDSEMDARNVCDNYDVAGLASYDVAFVEKENKWAIVYCDLYPNLVKGSSCLHVEFNDQSEGNRMFFCNFHHKMHGTPDGFCDVRQFLNKA